GMADCGGHADERRANRVGINCSSVAPRLASEPSEIHAADIAAQRRLPIVQYSSKRLLIAGEDRRCAQASRAKEHRARRTVADGFSQEGYDFGQQRNLALGAGFDAPAEV